MPATVDSDRLAKLLGESIGVSSGIDSKPLINENTTTKRKTTKCHQKASLSSSVSADKGNATVSGKPTIIGRSTETRKITLKPTFFTFNLPTHAAADFSAPRKSRPSATRAASPKSFSHSVDEDNPPTAIIYDPLVGNAGQSSGKCWVAPPVSKLQWRALSEAAASNHSNVPRPPSAPQSRPSAMSSPREIKSVHLWEHQDSVRPQSARTRPNSRGTPNFHDVKTIHGHTATTIRTPAEAAQTFPGVMLAPRQLVRSRQNKLLDPKKDNASAASPAGQVLNISSRDHHRTSGRPASSMSTACYDPDARYRYWLSTPTPAPTPAPSYESLVQTPKGSAVQHSAASKISPRISTPSDNRLSLSPRKVSTSVIPVPVTIVGFGPKFSDGLVGVGNTYQGTSATNIYSLPSPREAVDLGINTIPVASFRRV